MGGKGIKRREKNYRASHGGTARLPPPPDLSSIDALPSKLRKLMAFTEAEKKPPRRTVKGGEDSTKTHHLEEKSTSNMSGIKRKTNDDLPADSDVNEKKNKKKKRKKVHDLRFESIEEFGGTGSKRKERRKQHLKDRKKKNKPTGTQVFDFPRHEQIKFGEVVDAPPKLVALPKVRKMAHGASQERLRLKAVEAYRNKKGWESRPGLQLTPPVTAMPSL
ncbi:unnamed protein product [Cuscuta campestris]|uniref:Uncharacterized protein n=2 Tax=Cuscuta sect. Cleistogrammica TaxID=1824901 RepID=A0A484M0K9_9ASTE|nr:hypothetical protein DM860_000635 [Cuscuta australis]VFQ82340.1 unnamed protein product [Cuscuta campestris]